MYAQLTGIERWMDARARWEATDRPGVGHTLQREHEALVARAQLHQLGSVWTFHDPPKVRVVLAHRNQWMRDKLAALLSVAGVSVVGSFADGADAAGTLVVEQPDLLFVEDHLPTLVGGTVVRRAREFAPETVVAVQVADSAGVAEMVDAGAHAVFTRRVPPAEMVEQLVPCLTGKPRPVILT